MYAPKIKDELVQAIYYIAKRKGIPMTKVLESAVKKYLTDEDVNIESAKEYCRRERGVA